MKKRFSLIMLFVLLATLLLVSCNPESSALDETIDVSLTGLNRTERSLDSKLEAFDSESLVWKYKAVKKDNSGFTTGEKTEETLLPANGSIGAISQGYWEFSLFGYKDSTLVYEGKTEARVAKSSSTTKITILVTPKQTESGKGTLLVASDILKNGNYKVVVSLTGITNTSFTKSSTFDVVNGSLSSDMRITELSSGSYSVEVSFVNTDDNGTITYVKEPVVVNIYDSLETTVYGSVSETLENVTLTPKTDGSVLASITKSFDSTEETTITVNSSPLSDEKSTSVVIPQGTTLEDENGDAITADKVKLEIVTHPVTSSIILSSDNFTVEDDKSVVAALDINLSAGEKVVKSFGGEKVTITTYIAKGLSNVSVKYNGNGAQPDAVPNYETDAAWTSANTETGYSRESGKLVFTTTHFSSYYVVTDAVVAIDKEGNVYSSLKTALNSGKDEIILIKDINLTEQLLAPTSKIVLNLNGHTLSSDFPKGAIKLINKADLTITGNGTIKENSPNFAPIIVHGSLMNNVKLTVKDGVILEGWSGVFVNQNSNKNKGINVELDSITINAKNDSNGDNGTAIYVNGQITEKTKCPIIKVKNSTLNSTGNGIYAAGNADWTLDNNTINAASSGIEIRAGKMTINSGSTSTSASSFSYEANGSGTTANGAALVVSQHNTSLPIDVTINGGTFLGPVKLAVVNTIGDKLSNVTVNTNNKIDSADIKILPEDNFQMTCGVIFNSKFSTVTDAASFERAFNDSSVSYVKLSDDISLSGKSVSFSSGNKIIDLNGNTLTLDSGTFDVVVSNGAYFTIKNGTVKLPTAANTNIKPIDLNNGGKLSLENVTFDTDNTTLPCFFDCSDSKSELYLKDTVKEKNQVLGVKAFKLFMNAFNYSNFSYNFDLYKFENGKYEKHTESVNNYLLDVSWS